MMFAARSVSRGEGSSEWPSIIEIADTQSTSLVSSRALNMPSGISVGDLLVALYSPGVNYACTPSAGWTTLFNIYTTYSSLRAYYKIADGGDTLTVTNTTGSNSSVAMVMRVAQANYIDATTDVSVNGSSANPNPPSHTPTISGKNYMYLIGFSGAGTAVATGAPTNYSGLHTLIGVDGNATSLSIAVRNNLDAAEDPGAFAPSIFSPSIFTAAIYSTS